MTTRLYIAKIEVPGIDAHLNPEIALFDTPAEAWGHLYTERCDDEFNYNEECSSALAQTLRALARGDMSHLPALPDQPHGTGFLVSETESYEHDEGTVYSVAEIVIENDQEMNRLNQAGIRVCAFVMSDA